VNAYQDSSTEVNHRQLWFALTGTNVIRTRAAMEPRAKMVSTHINAFVEMDSVASIARSPSTIAQVSLSSVRTEASVEAFLRRPQPLVIALMAIQETFAKRTSTNA